MTKDLIVEIVPEKESIITTYKHRMDRFEKIEAQIKWLWSAIDEIWETMPQEPEPQERDEP